MLHPVPAAFIEHSGLLTQSLGLGRALGQIYAYLYFSQESRTLDDMTAALGISKGGASMTVRQLEQWGAVQRVWVKGDRRDHYIANDYFGRIVRNIVAGILGARMESLAALLAAAEKDLAGNGKPSAAGGNGEMKFLRDRVDHLRKFHLKAQKLWGNPLVKRMVR
jgi:DNA-binding transcriptional regulator GbsR (MarR family)